jgi:DNA-nicking Smr family endonuclease
MSDDSFKSLMQETGVEPIEREVRIRPKKALSSDEIEIARARAEDAVTTRAHHGLSTEEPPPIDPLKPLEYVAYEIDRRVLGLLDEAPFPAQYEIDLHGYTVDEAAYAITALFQTIREHRLTHIRITHGVGRHSKDGRPLLKAYVNRWLKNNPDIVAFASARRSDGGVGVVNAVTSGLFDDRWERT